MKKPQNKKRSPALLGIAVFIAIVVIMFIANSQTFTEAELDPPIDGVVSLETIDGSVVVVSQTNEMHIRDWNDITAKPLKIVKQADMVALMAGSKFLSIPSGRDDTVEIECLKKDCSPVTIPLGYGMRCKVMGTNRTGKMVGLVVVDSFERNGNGSYPEFSVAVITAAGRLLDIATIENSDSNLELSDISISDDSKYIALVGGKDNLGWICLIDVEQKQLLWEKISDLSSQFDCAAFSPDGLTIYVGGLGRNIPGFEVMTGKLVNKWQMGLTQKAQKKQYTPAIATSNDGRLVASATEPSGVIYLWDTRKNASAGRLPIGHILISGIAFSPDDRYIAAGGILTKNKIKILKVP